jgi:hypothetical protein
MPAAARPYQDKSSVMAPATRAVPVTPNDGTDLTYNAKALWVGGAGNINLDTIGGDTILISGIPAGTVLPIQARRVRSTNTTATLIVALG